ncbi:MAG: sigma-70 family RNA polymerase sigma factor [Deltaproteobacteria bacterium]|nr:sigma-70 family RNA polymerase sigma factor [Deltaproteobacteria bacterium]
MTGARVFPTTRWSLVVSARGDSPSARRALQELLSTYWSPLYAFARSKGLAREDAEDAVQAVCARLIQAEFAARVEADRGRLRAYLRASLANHLRGQHERETRQKRGGDAVVVELDGALLDRLDAAPHLDPGDAFDRQWARQVMERALARLEEEFEAEGRSGPLGVVRAYFSGQELPPYGELAATHDTTVTRIKSLLHRARARFRVHLRDEIADTVRDPADVDSELSTLIAVLSA